MTTFKLQNVDIIEFPSTTLVTKTHRGNPELLGKTINQFIQWRKAKQLPPSRYRTFNLIYSDPRQTTAENFKFSVGVEIDLPAEQLTKNLEKTEIPTGLCAKYRHIGIDDELSFITQCFYDEFLPNSGYQLRDFPLFFQRVKFYPEVPAAQAITDIFIPLHIKPIE